MRKTHAALIFASFLAAPAHAAVLTYDIDVPGVIGGGSFSFDDSAIVWNVPGDHTQGGTTPLTDFAYLFDGSLFLLADDPGAVAWFWGTPDYFAGIQYSAAFGGDSIDFSSGFGVDPNDLGTFEGFGTELGLKGPIDLTPSDITSTATAVPEPGTWLASILAGMALLAGRLWRRSPIGTVNAKFAPDPC